MKMWSKRRITSGWKENIFPFLRTLKKWIFTGLKILGKIAIRIVAVAVLAAVFVVPFLPNKLDKNLAQWIWYPNCALFLLLLALDRRWHKEPTFKIPIFEFYYKTGLVLVLPFFLSIFVFNYYDIDRIWLWVIFVMVAIAAPCFFFSLYVFENQQAQRSDEDKSAGALNVAKHTLLFWLYDLFYMAIFNRWQIPVFVFGTIAIVVIFYTVASAFLSGKKMLQPVLPFDLLLGMALTIYLIYIVPDEALQNIILAVVVSVLGGIIALVGVAWTIRHTNQSRQEDLLRMETDRREEERKKHIPYIRISFDKELPPIVVDAHIRTGIDFENPVDIATIKDKVYFSVNIRDFNIKNVSNANIFLKGVILQQTYYPFDQIELVEPGACCRVQTTNNYMIAMAEAQESIRLVICDILGNDYEVTCPVSHSHDSVRLQQFTTVEDIEYMGHSCTYVVISADIPVLIDG